MPAQRISELEQALEAEKALLQTLINTIPHRIYVKDRQSRFILNNIAHLKALGAGSQDEALGRTDRDFRPPSLAERSLADDQKVMQDDSAIVDLEEPTILPTGETGTLLISKSPLHDATGEVVGLVGISCDISDRKRTEDKLRRNAEIQTVLREIAETAVLTISTGELYAALHRLVGRVLPAKNFRILLLDEESGELKTVYGTDETGTVPVQRLPGRYMVDYVMRQRRAMFVTPEEFERLRSAGEIDSRFVEWKEWMGAPLFDSQENVVGAVALFSMQEDERCGPEDVAILSVIAAQVSLAIERKRVHDSLRESEQRFSNAFHFAGIGMALVSPDGRWIKVNPALCRFFGYTAEELMFRTVEELTCCDDRLKDQALRRKLLAGEIDSYQTEKRYRTQRGDIVWATVSQSLVRTAEGQPLYFVAQIEDLSERKRLEQELRLHANKLEETVELRTRELFSANQELTAANEELTSMNEEMTAMNDTLEIANRNLAREIGVRQQKEQEARIRERQYQATASLLTSHGEDFDTVMKTILNEALRLIGAPGGYISLLDEAGKNFVFLLGVNCDYETQPGSQPAERGLMGQVFRSGEIQYVEDYRVYLHRIPDPRYDGLTTGLMAPLKREGKVQGVLTAHWRDEVHAITAEDIEVFRQYGVLASLAMERVFADARISRQNELLTRLAFQDTLTGLPNRASLNRYLTEQMERARAGESAGAVLFIDLDDLKAINDSFGHSAGDTVIQAAADQITVTVGSEAFLARVGGDEFIVVLPGKDVQDRIGQIADTLVSASHREYEVGGQKIHMSASVGITLYPRDGNAAEEILKNADNAMYAAKAAGKNCWRFFEPEMLKDAYEKLLLTNDLRHALERGELFLHFQPQILLDGRKVTGFEALLRWDAKNHGLLPPGRFIPLAEQSGLIVPIGQWVILEACRFARLLTDSGRSDAHVAVNVSPRQLAAPDFVDVVRRCIEETGISAGQLEVEITENVLIESLEDSTRKLGALNALGIRLTLDDFGTGYSSLTYLRNLPVQTLKIDKSFVDRILHDEVQEGFIRSIIEMAHVLGLCVVAEGVETESQLAKLSHSGCDSVQGYVFSKPVPLAEAIGYRADV